MSASKEFKEDVLTSLRETIEELRYIDLSWDDIPSRLPGCDVETVANNLAEKISDKVFRRITAMIQEDK